MSLVLARVSDIGFFGLFLLCVLLGTAAGVLVDSYGKQRGWRESDRAMAGVIAFAFVVAIAALMGTALF
ncbi:MAG: hypothetical protein U0R52_07490 [Solirubrobacterales bacterium]